MSVSLFSQRLLLAYGVVAAQCPAAGQDEEAIENGERAIQNPL